MGSAVFLRYSLTNFLRFWLARQAFDLDSFGDRLVTGSAPAVGAHSTQVKEGIHDDHGSAAIARG
ncbi:hypothetical protein G3I15_21800 [Streptomyces sp. SID10244]|nr:hypothetical protein [Streptomyces sp. SID10244]